MTLDDACRIILDCHAGRFPGDWRNEETFIVNLDQCSVGYFLEQGQDGQSLYLKALDTLRQYVLGFERPR